MATINNLGLMVCVIVFMVVDINQAARLNKEERNKLRDAVKENEELRERLTKMAACKARVDELDYHNRALDMISNQQLPKQEEKAKKAISKLKLAYKVEGEWRLYFTVSLLAFVLSASYKGYNYTKHCIKNQQDKLRKEKADLKAEKRKKR